MPLSEMTFALIVAIMRVIATRHRDLVKWSLLDAAADEDVLEPALIKSACLSTQWAQWTLQRLPVVQLIELILAGMSLK